MKKFLFLSFVFAAFCANSQEARETVPAAKGVVYGTAPADKNDAVNINDLQAKMSTGAFEGRVTGKVKEVCKTMGCWIRLEKGDGTTVKVKAKEHSFFMPENLTGKTVVIEGTAAVKEVSEEKRKHFAEDAGKTKEEIKKIKGSEKEMQIVATGVKVLD